MPLAPTNVKLAKVVHQRAAAVLCVEEAGSAKEEALVTEDGVSMACHVISNFKAVVCGVRCDSHMTTINDQQHMLERQLYHGA